jgi:hypothetical protein
MGRCPRNLITGVILWLIPAIPSSSIVPAASALKPVRGYPATPSDYGIIHQQVTFSSGDSLRLVGWFYPEQDTAGIANEIIGRVIPVPENLRREPRPYPSESPALRPTIIICDGDGGNMADLIFYAYQFFTRGFHVFTFDWRGFGGSAEWPMDPDQLCCSEFLLDYDAAIRHVAARPEVDPNRIALLGFSTGAYLSFTMLATRPEIGAFAGRALMTSFQDLLSILHELDPARNWRAPADFPPALLPVRVAPGVRVPVFLAVGEKDVRTPPRMSEEIMALLEGPKELWIVPGAGHGGPASPEFTNYPEFFERVSAFFGKHIGQP